MKPIVDITLEIRSAMEPWAGADETVTVEPLGAVVTGGGTAIGGGVVVAVGTIGGYADRNIDLSIRFRRGSRYADSGNECKCQKCNCAHEIHLVNQGALDEPSSEEEFVGSADLADRELFIPFTGRNDGRRHVPASANCSLLNGDVTKYGRMTGLGQGIGA